MTGSADDLTPVVAAARGEPGMIAGRVTAAGGHTERAVVGRLGLDRATLQKVLLCAPPAPSRFAPDVHAIAEFVGADPAALAAVLREVDAVGALRCADHPVDLADEPGLLAAARDARDDHVTPATDQAVRLRELVDRFWDAAPDRVRRDRDVEAAVAWSVRLAVVATPRLTLAGVRAWLRERDVPVAGDPADRPLHGFLVAWRGVGVVFCDGGLGPAERRFTVAHEVGHFLLDYDEPRRRVLRDAPELLEVVDDIRPATAPDRAQAVLARVPLGVHTHLLDAGAGEPETEDAASRFALELLAPWDETLDLVRQVTAEPAPYRVMLDRGAEQIAGQFMIPPAAARTRARQALDVLDIRPGFFDR